MGTTKKPSVVRLMAQAAATHNGKLRSALDTNLDTRSDVLHCDDFVDFFAARGQNDCSVALFLADQRAGNR